MAKEKLHFGTRIIDGKKVATLMTVRGMFLVTNDGIVYHKNGQGNKVQVGEFIGGALEHVPPKYTALVGRELEKLTHMYSQLY